MIYVGGTCAYYHIPGYLRNVGVVGDSAFFGTLVQILTFGG